MIVYNLERFANSTTNLEQCNSIFWYLVDKNGILSMIFYGVVLLHCEYKRIQVDA